MLLCCILCVFLAIFFRIRPKPPYCQPKKHC
ncbi:TPA: hypothetical protein SCS14_004811 [Escherichia coli]|nr:hypothetical protein [Escherichia coli]